MLNVSERRHSIDQEKNQNERILEASYKDYARSVSEMSKSHKKAVRQADRAALPRTLHLTLALPRTLFPLPRCASCAPGGDDTAPPRRCLCRTGRCRCRR